MRCFFLFFILVLSCSDPKKEDTTFFSDTVMTMQYRVIIGEPLSFSQKKRVRNIINAAFLEIDRIYNKWNPSSEISFLNQTKAYVKTPLSPELAHFLQETDKIVSLTKKRFDPTIEPLLRLWKSKMEKGLVPSQEEIESVSQAVGWEKIHIDEGLFWKEHEATSLDLGGIAKGYAIDLITERLNHEGFLNVYVEWGGEIRASGEHPEGRPWRVSLSTPSNGRFSQNATIIDLKDAAIATSGDYFQNWTVDGITYFHLIDPAKGAPLIATADSIASATVVAPSCMLADALASAAMLFATPQEAESWLASQPEQGSLRYWILTRRQHPS